MIADPDGLSVNNRKRERQTNGKRRAFADDGTYIDFTAKHFDVFANNIHADTATGYIGDFFGSRKAGMKDQFENFLLREFLSLLNNTRCDSFFKDFFAIKSLCHFMSVSGEKAQQMSDKTLRPSLRPNMAKYIRCSSLRIIRFLPSLSLSILFSAFRYSIASC